MQSTRRLQKELSDLQKSPIKAFREIEVDESNIFLWHGLIVPENPPYNKGAFRVKITFPPEYPFKPPKILFLTKIYHPNVDEQGNVCLGMIRPEHWKPAMRTEQVINALLSLVNDPEPDHPLREDLAKEYLSERRKFMENAESFTKRHAEKRPKN